VLQRHTVQKLHGDECLLVLFANVVNRADVGMVQCGRGLGLALKAGECLWVTGNVFRQEFEGDESMKACVLGLVNHTHPAATQLLHNAVVRDGLADHWRRILCG
jgi:hypothetical protein